MAKSKLELEFIAKGEKAEAMFRRSEALLKRLANELKGGGAEARKAAREQKRLAQEAKRFYDQTRTPQERYNNKMKQLGRLLKNNKDFQDTYNRAAKQAGDELKEAGRKGQKAFGPQALGMLKTFAGAAGIGSVGGALMAVNSGYQTWLENIREVSAEAKKASNEIIAFAALQEGGTKAKRVMEASELAARYGITDRGQAFTTIQAMQSVYGDFDRGKEAAEVIFRGAQVGVPVESGREMEILAYSQGMRGGEALRRAYVAGEASGRDPATIAKAGEGFGAWDDKDLAFAAAAIISGSVPENKLQSHMTRGGVALSQVGTAQKSFEEVGLGDADRFTRIKYLHEQGIDTLVKVKKFGVTELRGQKSLATLAKNFDDLVRIQKEIAAKAKPGLLIQKRAAVEEEIPTAKLSRVIKSVDVRFANEQAFGPYAMRAMKEEKTQAIRALAFERMGRRQAGWFDLITKSDDGGGRSTGLDAVKYHIGQAVSGEGISALGKWLHGTSEIQTTMEQIRKELAESTRLQGQIQKNTSPHGHTTSTLSKPDEDR